MQKGPSLNRSLVLSRPLARDSCSGPAGFARRKPHLFPNRCELVGAGLRSDVPWRPYHIGGPIRSTAVKGRGWDSHLTVSTESPAAGPVTGGAGAGRTMTVTITIERESDARSLLNRLSCITRLLYHYSVYMSSGSLSHKRCHQQSLSHEI